MRIENLFHESEINTLSNTVFRLIRSEPELTERNPKEIKRWMQRGHLHVVFANGHVIGFIAKDGLDGEYDEILSWFVKKRFRGKGIGKKLLRKVVEGKNRKYLMSTFQKKVADLVTRFGFKKTQVAKLPLKVAIKYVMKKRLSSIMKHSFQTRSTLMMYDADN
jgi:N-acetylglutamate synthase-like GNAT family acetyltransferase